MMVDMLEALTVEMTVVEMVVQMADKLDLTLVEKLAVLMVAMMAVH